MTQDRFALVPAAYLVLLREPEAGRREVLLQLRRGTAYMDGWWACGAAGHVEQGETALQGAAREAREELGIEVLPEDLDLAATVQRTCVVPSDHPELEERIDIFVTATAWTGEPTIQEEGKAGELRWWPLDELPERVVPHERAALQSVAAGERGTFHAFGFEQRLTLIAAVGRNGVIGDGREMPWHLPEDLRFFKSTTMDGVLVMGRGTWDSIGRALPGRSTIVVTRQPGWSAPGAEVAHSLCEALTIAGDGEVFVAGGGQIYAQTIGHAHRLLLTQVDLEPQGQTRFPTVDPDLWQEVSRTPGEPPVTAWVTWERR
ncbi:dihydrofolate reductase [Ornithinimicrobium pratense]|uniref:dihydrofolate reductase n=1 Tax=Ornithinimicrobium pratense TaxID=2593973 RepID=A0A5J6V7V3_9MICO|nr:dihydrofolate reductase [Ornithinimicrobium pratense]QFG69092.1 NUDIX domain-containing protein [Ornithinimicrobium pratense]